MSTPPVPMKHLTSNTRVMYHGDNIPWFAVHEVHYENGKPTRCSEEPVQITAESVEDIEDFLRTCLEACEKPVLDYDSFTTGEL